MRKSKYLLSSCCYLCWKRKYFASDIESVVVWGPFRTSFSIKALVHFHFFSCSLLCVCVFVCFYKFLCMKYPKGPWIRKYYWLSDDIWSWKLYYSFKMQLSYYTITTTTTLTAATVATTALVTAFKTNTISTNWNILIQLYFSRCQRHTHMHTHVHSCFYNRWCLTVFFIVQMDK